MCVPSNMYIAFVSKVSVLLGYVFCNQMECSFLVSFGFEK